MHAGNYYFCRFSIIRCVKTRRRRRSCFRFARFPTPAAHHLCRRNKSVVSSFRRGVSVRGGGGGVVGRHTNSSEKSSVQSRRSGAYGGNARGEQTANERGMGQRRNTGKSSSRRITRAAGQTWTRIDTVYGGVLCASNGYFRRPLRDRVTGTFRWKFDRSKCGRCTGRDTLTAVECPHKNTTRKITTIMTIEAD